MELVACNPADPFDGAPLSSADPVRAPAPTLRDRACGALLGLAVGDALGAPPEKMPPTQIRPARGPVSNKKKKKPTKL
ncbi:ADP-ribosylglycohydrolase family protein, partial [Streptomyces sp. NPDC058953]|uniref:ADP-ribosylglycohydrolase family protein n=1 Tax=Streptomyces sp. NPDC058953 TaxID=3346676 RepID=UPI003676676A